MTDALDITLVLTVSQAATVLAAVRLAAHAHGHGTAQAVRCLEVEKALAPALDEALRLSAPPPAGKVIVHKEGPGY